MDPAQLYDICKVDTSPVTVNAVNLWNDEDDDYTFEDNVVFLLVIFMLIKFT